MNRSSGLLLALSSLPSPYGIGDMGPSAYSFVDRLKEAGQKYWQVLPLGVVDEFGCPYASFSAFGGEPLLLSPEKLVQDGLIKKELLSLYKFRELENNPVDYQKVRFSKYQLLRQAYLEAKNLKWQRESFKRFIQKTESWSRDFALFMSLSFQYGFEWWKWPCGLSQYNSKELRHYKEQNSDEIEFHLFLQFLFYRQWHDLKNYANGHGILIVGDIPIFVSKHSMDVWRRPEHFKLTKDYELEYEAGAAPDDFSEIGQKWGTPLYYWDKMEKEGFAWWLERMGHTFETFDLVRLDHFRGFCAVWEVPHEDIDAKNGRWYPGPGAKLFDALVKRFGDLPIIVEDLGKITPDVMELKARYDFSGMKILQFAFCSDETNDNLPPYIGSKDIVYTGTHDTETVNGRFWSLPVKSKEREFLHTTLKLKEKGTEKNFYHWPLIEMAFESKALMAFIPLQDLFGYGNEARMNVPGVQEGNWKWRFTFEEIKPEMLERLKELTKNAKRNET